VQKPFTADELGQFINKLLVKRQARQEALRQPAVRVVSPARAEGNTGDDYCVPGGAFFSSGHVWARIEPDGHVRVGLDGFAQRALGNLGEALLPAPGLTVAAGDSLFAFRKGDRTVHFKAPLGGKVVEANPVLNVDASKAAQSPYKDGWVCRLQPSDLAGELPSLRIGKPVVDWYTQEIQRLQEAKAGKGSEPLAWEAIQESFLG
jgi:glycine cleavage system H protein